MEPDLFSYMHSGETKHIVSEFVYEVVLTLRWITNESRKTSPKKEVYDEKDESFYESQVNDQAKAEKEKVCDNCTSDTEVSALCVVPLYVSPDLYAPFLAAA